MKTRFVYSTTWAQGTPRFKVPDFLTPHTDVGWWFYELVQCWDLYALFEIDRPGWWRDCLFRSSSEMYIPAVTRGAVSLAALCGADFVIDAWNESRR